MTPLRQRMIDDLKIRNYSEDTVRSYVRAVAALAGHFRLSPDQLSLEQIRTFFLHLIERRKPSWSWYNVYVCGIRFFYRVTLGRDWPIEHLPYARPAPPRSRCTQPRGDRSTLRGGRRAALPRRARDYVQRGPSRL